MQSQQNEVPKYVFTVVWSIDPPGTQIDDGNTSMKARGQDGDGQHGRGSWRNGC